MKRADRSSNWLLVLIGLTIFLFLDDRNRQSPPLSVKDKQEKAKRCQFVQGLLLSTILDDGL